MAMKKFLILILLVSTPHLAQETIEVRDLMLENYEYSYPVEYFEVHSQQEKLSMAYMFIKAERSNGKTITLLHGKNFNGAYWQTTIDTLVAEGYDVLVPDQIGFGKSSKLENFQYSFQQLALNTKLLLDSLEIPTTAIMGHSMGGMLATRFALMYPNITTKLILLNPIGLEDWKIKVPYQSIDEWYAQELEQTYTSIKKYQQENYYDGEWKEEYAQWAKLLAGWTLNENYPLIAWNAALTYDMVFTQPVVYEFNELAVPTLLLIGTRDRTALGKNLVSPEVRESMGRYDRLGKITAEKIPAASLVELENVGHLPHIEAFPEYISALLEYLKN
jgi:pimeloyl-ACP methyl ester carboxylesterase